MKERSPAQSCSPTPFDRFKDLVGKLLSVPKKEVDKKEAEYQRKKAKRRKKQKPV
jgi:hypothetical protein